MGSISTSRYGPPGVHISLVDLDRGVHIYQWIWTGGQNLRGSKSTGTPVKFSATLKMSEQWRNAQFLVQFSLPAVHTDGFPLFKSWHDQLLDKLKQPSLSKRKFSILFMMAYSMAYNGVTLSMFFMQLHRNRAFSQSKLTFSKCYFIIIFTWVPHRYLP